MAERAFLDARHYCQEPVEPRRRRKRSPPAYKDTEPVVAAAKGASLACRASAGHLHQELAAPFGLDRRSSCFYRKNTGSQAGYHCRVRERRV